MAKVAPGSRQEGGVAVHDYESTSSLSTAADGSMASLVQMTFGHCSLISC